MIVKASNPMTKALAAALPEYTFRLEKLTPQQFSLYVDIDAWKHDDDYNARTGKMQAIKVIYPDNYYCYPHYLTTRDLIKAFRKSDKTLNGFIQEVKNEIEV